LPTFAAKLWNDKVAPIAVVSCSTTGIEVRPVEDLFLAHLWRSRSYCGTQQRSRRY
jgi:hypothetical protein